jgi:hypothetical protein
MHVLYEFGVFAHERQPRTCNRGVCGSSAVQSPYGQAFLEIDQRYVGGDGMCSCETSSRKRHDTYTLKWKHHVV